jgi:hypothetical protein
LTDLPPLEVARQLTLIEQNIFLDIHLSEYYGAKWTKKEAPKIEEASLFSNKLSYWLAWLIVREDKIKMRVTHLTYVINLGKVWIGKKGKKEGKGERKRQREGGDYVFGLKPFSYVTFLSLLPSLPNLLQSLLDLCNFNSLMSVYLALSLTPITRLHNTWKQVPKSGLLIWKRIKDFMSPIGNFAQYREALKHRDRDQPMVPCRGRFFFGRGKEERDMGQEGRKE